ncbi:unannotated protein [freshwater metagenome]|uniref:Unannotated protein n=1 Tax=freshwater metagenome TaxID=449393 RepID=A0A6J7S000_9ZZZZ
MGQPKQLRVAQPRACPKVGAAAWIRSAACWLCSAVGRSVESAQLTIDCAALELSKLPSGWRPNCRSTSEKMSWPPPELMSLIASAAVPQSDVSYKAVARPISKRSTPSVRVPLGVTTCTGFLFSSFRVAAIFAAASGPSAQPLSALHAETKFARVFSNP